MYKFGDKVRVTNLTRADKKLGLKIGDERVVTDVTKSGNVFVKINDDVEQLLSYDQIELIQLSPPTQFNFITKRHITEHLQNVITFYEDYTSDLLKESSRDYKEDIIDLKETGYEFRLELDKILIQVEEQL